MVSEFGAAHPYLFQMLVPPPPPRDATISLVPDSEGHKPKRIDNNSCGINKLLSDGPVLLIIVHKQLVRIYLGVIGLSTRSHIDRSEDKKKFS